MHAIARFALASLGSAVLIPSIAWPAGIGGGPVADGYNNSIGVGLSAGVGIGRNSWLWGWAIEYSRVLSSEWTFNTSLAWDRDTERKTQGDEVEDTYSITAAVIRNINDRLFLGGGFGHGLYQKKEGSGEWQSVRLGKDLAVGVLAGYTLWSSGRHEFTPVAALEYNVSDNEWQITVDLGYNYSF